MTWKAGLVAAAFGAAAFIGGCGGDAPDPAGEAERAVPEAAAARLATAEFGVDGMTCGGCALATEMSVRKLDGVASADAEYDAETGEGRCTVEYDPAAVSPEAIAEAIRKAGFRPTLRGTTEGG